MPNLSSGSCNTCTSGPSLNGGSCGSGSSAAGVVSEIGLKTRNFELNSLTQDSLSLETLTFQGTTVFTAPEVEALNAISSGIVQDGSTGVKVDSTNGYILQTKGTLNAANSIDSTNGTYNVKTLNTNLIYLTGTTSNSLFDGTLVLQPTSGKVRLKDTNFNTYTFDANGYAFLAGNVVNTNGTFVVEKTGGSTAYTFPTTLYSFSFAGTTQLAGALRLGVNTTSGNSGYTGLVYVADGSSSNYWTMYNLSTKQLKLFPSELNFPGNVKTTSTTTPSNCAYTFQTNPAIMHLQCGTAETEAGITMKSMNWNDISGIPFDSKGSLDNGTTGTTTLTNSNLSLSYVVSTGLFTYTGTNPIWVRIKATFGANLAGSGNRFLGICIKEKDTAAASTWANYYGTQCTSANTTARVSLNTDCVIKLSNGNVFAVGTQSNGIQFSARDTSLQRTNITITAL